MGRYLYVAKSRQGEELSGYLSAETEDQVLARLHGRDLIVLRVLEESGHGPASAFTRAALAQSFTPRPSTRDLALFSRQLATLVGAGVPLITGLEGLARDAGSRRMSKAVTDVVLRLERGESLADALAANPTCFNPMYVGMVRVGERTGALPEILEDLATYLERSDAIQNKVRAALAYPVLLFCFTISAACFLLFKVVPTFAEVYADFGQELPALTRTVVGISTAFRAHAALTAAVALLLITLLAAAMRTQKGRYARDAMLLRLPIFGSLIRKSVLSRFSRTFSLVLRTGLPLVEGLEAVKDSTGNLVIVRAIDEARNDITAGAPITQAFRATGKFPETALQLMSTGEETGELSAMLSKASEFYDRQVEATIHGLTSLIDPILIIGLGGFIGLIVVSMFLPIFNLGDMIMRGGISQ